MNASDPETTPAPTLRRALGWTLGGFVTLIVKFAQVYGGIDPVTVADKDGLLGFVQCDDCDLFMIIPPAADALWRKG